MATRDVQQEYFTELRSVLAKDCALYKKTLECYQLAQFYGEPACSPRHPLSSFRIL